MRAFLRPRTKSICCGILCCQRRMEAVLQKFSFRLKTRRSTFLQFLKIRAEQLHLQHVYLLSSLRLALGIQPTRRLWKRAATTGDSGTSAGVSFTFFRMSSQLSTTSRDSKEVYFRIYWCMKITFPTFTQTRDAETHSHRQQEEEHAGRVGRGRQAPPRLDEVAQSAEQGDADGERHAGQRA